VGLATTKTAKPTDVGFPPRRDHQQAQIFIGLLPGAVTVLLLPEQRRFAFPVAHSDLGFVFSLHHLQVLNFLVETVPLCFGPSLAQLQFEIEEGPVQLVAIGELRKKAAADGHALCSCVGRVKSQYAMSV
jgi:hypothetical protein